MPRCCAWQRLGWLYLSKEGTAIETLLAADLVVPDIYTLLGTFRESYPIGGNFTQMSLPKTESFPDDPDLMPPARRRRARRLLAPLEADERAATIDHLARRSSPTFDFFIFSALLGSAVLHCLVA